MPEALKLPADWTLPQTIRDRLGHAVGRQRAMVADGHLLLLLHAPPQPDETHRVGRVYWRDAAGTWRATAGLGSGATAFQRHLDEYDAAVEHLTDDEDAASGSAAYFEVIRRLGPIHRAAGNLHRTLQAARDALPGVRELIDLRDRSYEIQRKAELLYEVAKEGLEFEVAQHSEQLAEDGYRMSISAHRLNVLAAFFFPIVTLASIFGMNFDFGGEPLRLPLPFFVILGLGLAFGFLLRGYVALPLGANPLARRRRAGLRSGASASDTREPHES